MSLITTNNVCLMLLFIVITLNSFHTTVEGYSVLYKSYQNKLIKPTDHSLKHDVIHDHCHQQYQHKHYQQLHQLQLRNRRSSFSFSLYAGKYISPIMEDRLKRGLLNSADLDRQRGRCIYVYTDICVNRQIDLREGC